MRYAAAMITTNIAYLLHRNLNGVSGCLSKRVFTRTYNINIVYSMISSRSVVYSDNTTKAWTAPKEHGQNQKRNAQVGSCSKVSGTLILEVPRGT